MSDFTGDFSDNVSQTQNEEEWRVASNVTTSEKWTLEDGSVILEDWTLLSPENYLLYLLQFYKN